VFHHRGYRPLAVGQRPALLISSQWQHHNRIGTKNKIRGVGRMITKTSADCNTTDVVSFLSLATKGVHMKKSYAAVLILIVGLASCVRPTDPNPSSLSNTQWSLITLRGQPTIEGVEYLEEDVALHSHPSLEFGNDTFKGYSGCNLFGGNYTATETTLMITEYGGHDVGCPDPVGQQEVDYYKALEEVTNYRIIDNHLELANSIGTTILVFASQAPDLESF
jgi:heat shock protein HslJ